MLTLSGPVELLFLLWFIAAWTCVVVSVMLVVCSFSVFLSMCLFVLCFMFECVGELFVECVCYLCGCGECFFVFLFFCWLIRVLSSKEYV